ncbi:hypothetical protein F2Q70_00016910 [Brassica cretica]|uniref:Uncharacterized protein n=1 Tax=Brassica cretica TaxID=69181 RepID=A0A8S9HZZ2_BRACR|nr:hypothetical protein F2Q70_00016910 [Brassica cretica]
MPPVLGQSNGYIRSYSRFTEEWSICLARESCRGDEGTSIDGAPLVSIKGEGVIDVLQWVLDLLSFVDDSWPRPGILCSRILQWAYIVVRMTKIALINMIHLFSAGPWWHIATYYPDRNGTWPGQVSELSIYFSEYVGFLAYVPYDWISAGERSTEEHKPWKSPVPSSMMVKTTHLQFLSGRTRPFVEAWRLILCRITLRYRSVSPMSSEFLLILLWNIEFRRALYSDPVGHMDLSFETRRRRILILLSRTIVSIDLIRYRILSSGDGPLSMSIACGLLSRLHSLPFVEPFEMSSSSIGQLHGTKTFLGCVVLPFQVAGVYMDKMILLLLHMRGESCRGDEGTSIDGAPLVSIKGDSRKRAEYISRPTFPEDLGGTEPHICRIRMAHGRGKQANCRFTSVGRKSSLPGSRRVKTMRLSFSFSGRTRPIVEADYSSYHPEVSKRVA